MNIEKRLPGSDTYDSITKIAPPTVVIAGPDYKAEIAELLETFFSEAGIQSVNLHTDTLTADQVAQAIHPIRKGSFSPTAILITGNRTQSTFSHLTEPGSNTLGEGIGEDTVREILKLFVMEELSIPLLFLLSGGILEREVDTIKQRIINSIPHRTANKAELYKQIIILNEMVTHPTLKAITEEIRNKCYGNNDVIDIPYSEIS